MTNGLVFSHFGGENFCSSYYYFNDKEEFSTPQNLHLLILFLPILSASAFSPWGERMLLIVIIMA